jgi:hypothetical protein
VADRGADPRGDPADISGGPGGLGAAVMADYGPVSQAMMAIARDVGDVGDVGDERVLARSICQACVSGLVVDGAALSLLTMTTARHTMHASDPTAELLEELQFSLNEGVCIQAAQTGYPVVIEDMRHTDHEGRWPMFAAAVAEQTPVRALWAFPLRWGTANLGVVEVYRRTPGGLTPQQYRDVLGAMDTAALMVLTLRTEPSPGIDHNTDPSVDRAGMGNPVEGLVAQGWLDSMVAARAQVHQATGMVLAQLGVSSTEALARLRARAFAEQRLLIDVARDAVARRLSFTPDEDETS